MSKGDHAFAKNQEFDTIWELCDKEEIKKVHYIICKKKESAKFFKMNGGSFGNPEPGTIIASEVVENREKTLEGYKTCEFYLLSQPAKVGVPTPTKYVLFSTIDPQISKEEEAKVF